MHSPTASSHRIDRRTPRRYSPLPGIFCRVNLADVGDAMPAGLMDVSEGGVGLMLRRPIPPETTLTVTLINSPGLFACTRTATVRYVRNRPDGDFHVGCQFDAPLAHRELQFLQA